MDKRIYLLAIISFVVGMVELIIGGLLDLVASDLGVSLGQAGLLITVFSLAFAISAPVLLTMTVKMERSRLMMISLAVFLAGNIVAVFSPFYGVLLVGRILSAASGSLLIALCMTMASYIVSEEYRARAIGIVFMGISASLVLGVPIGLMLGNAFGWRAPFVLISVLTLLSMAGVYFFLGKVAPKPAVPIGVQLKTLKSRKIALIQITSFLLMTGHLAFYGYLTPFLKMNMGLDGNWVSMVYLIFGIAAVIGGGLGGHLADRFGAKSVILTLVAMFGITLFALPFAAFSLTVFLFTVVIWSMLSWAITPAIHSYLIEVTPETSDIQQTLNNSAVHMGMAFGSMIGGIMIETTSVEYNAAAGSIFIIIALGTAALSMAKKKTRTAAAE
ncbi:MFS transporter [Paenibacillus sp. FSL R5-0490]|uniref:MFS transporter n=1 Tax=Paenibacillus sp. FSL R5-0490 TaxID=1920424 RepID=UPI00096EDAF0|nr:MFS transporter [Paenibacillus sp. FSL R5-0490]OMF60817.1 MFS transporter [Paenibacillus sp. FSL R5-0490]